MDLKEIDFMNFKEKLLNKTKKCWAFMNSFRTGLMCSFCSPVQTLLYSSEVKELELDKSVCTALKNDCDDLILMNIRDIYPLLNKVNLLTRCNGDGSLFMKAVNFIKEF